MDTSIKNVHVHLLFEEMKIINFLLPPGRFFGETDVINKLILSGNISCIFICYAPEERSISFYAKLLKIEVTPGNWTPVQIGVIHYSENEYGLVFCLPVTDKHILGVNQETLKNLVNWAESVKKLLRADQVSFAGILPAIMKKRIVLRNEVERRVTSRAVIKAIIKIASDKWGAVPPVIIIGGGGYIGTEVVDIILKIELTNFIAITETDKRLFLPIINEMRGMPLIIVDVSMPAAADNYIKQIEAPWDDLIFVNEVYPISSTTTTLLQKTGIQAYHILGFDGQVIPPLPGYFNSEKRGIPCCAGLDQLNGQVPDVLLSKI